MCPRHLATLQPLSSYFALVSSSILCALCLEKRRSLGIMRMRTARPLIIRPLVIEISIRHCRRNVNADKVDVIIADPASLSTDSHHLQPLHCISLLEAHSWLSAARDSRRVVSPSSVSSWLLRRLPTHYRHRVRWVSHMLYHVLRQVVQVQLRDLRWH